jgi:hypothetical protein
MYIARAPSKGFYGGIHFPFPLLPVLRDSVHKRYIKAYPDDAFRRAQGPVGSTNIPCPKNLVVNKLFNGLGMMPSRLSLLSLSSSYIVHLWRPRMSLTTNSSICNQFTGIFETPQLGVHLTPEICYFSPTQQCGLGCCTTTWLMWPILRPPYVRLSCPNMSSWNRAMASTMRLYCTRSSSVFCSGFVVNSKKIRNVMSPLREASDPYQLMGDGHTLRLVLRKPAASLPVMSSLGRRMSTRRPASMSKLRC